MKINHLNYNLIGSSEENEIEACDEIHVTSHKNVP